MVNLSIVKLLPKRVAELYKELKNITLKLHRTSGSIGFIKKALHHEVTPTFAQVKGNFININDRFKSEKSILLSHLNDYVCSYKPLISKHHYLLIKLKDECGTLLIAAVLRPISTIQQKERLDSFKTKNHKLVRLIQAKTPMSNYRVPIINLSDYDLSEVEHKQLQLALEYSFVNKNRALNKNLGANLETLPSQVSSFVDHTKLEDFHEFFRAYTDIFTKNIYTTKDYT